VVGIDETIEQKIDMYNCHVSQMYEWLPWNQGILDQVPVDKAERREWMAKGRRKDAEQIANKYRDQLINLYGAERGSRIKYAEAFEDSEYGSRLNKASVDHLFPFFGK
jgi:hypothetical protein